MKIITSVHDLILAMNNNEQKIYLISNLYDFLLKSNWNCVLSDNLKEYILDHDVIRFNSNN